MKPLVVLIIASAVAGLITWLTEGAPDPALAGRIGMAVMLVFTAIGHFAFRKGMAMMLPPAVPYKKELVTGTGVIEILGAIGLLVPVYETITGWLLIVFFILVLPANIYAAMNRVNHEKANHQGKSTGYLWFRIPLQLLFIVWVYFTSIYK